MSHPIPRSDFQYSWIKNTLGDEYSVESGQQVVYGHAPANGEVSSSSGFVPAITFPSASNLYGV